MSIASVSGIGDLLVTSFSMPSPTDTFDDKPNKFTIYLHQLAGSHEIEANVVLQDHCYTRPWNWKPENVYAKPVKKLFFPKAKNLLRNSDCHRQDEGIEIDILSDDATSEDRRHKQDPSSLPIDLTRPRQLMDECQRLAAFAKGEESEDWEEKIDKTFWTSTQSRVFAKVLKIFSSERLARLTKIGSIDEPIFRRTSIDTAARRFRETLASAGWDLKVAQWLHCLLFEHLPQEYLAIYLDILQTLRTKIPQLIDKIIAAQPNLNGKSGPITWETLGTLLKRSWDPVASTLNANKPNKLPGNPILVIAPCGSGATISSRQHKWISLLGTLGMVVNVPVHLGLAASKMTMMACIDQLVQATRTKIQDVRADCPGRPIILVGFNSGAALACQIAQMEHVTAVICLGFPFATAEGKRGAPDDSLMDIRCPVMFVIGQNATLARAEDLENLREKMLVETSLVVVGTADDHLRISTTKKISEGITQSMVDRCILDEIGDFVGSILLQPHPLPLRPVTHNTSVTSASTLSSLENKTKKELDKRKNSTSSCSMESEPNSPNAKKSRPNTPVSSVIASNVFTNIASSSTPMIRTTTTATPSAMLPIGQTSLKRKPRLMGNHKITFSDHSLTSKFASQNNITTNSNGGITLNIGSLASLAPIGPIRLAPSTQQSCQSNVCSQGKTIGLSKVSQGSPISKMSKLIPATSASIQTQGKIRTTIPLNKTFSKTLPSNQYKQLNITEENGEPRLFNVLPNTANQIRLSGTLSGTSTTILTQGGRQTGSTNLATLLHSGKNSINISKASLSAAPSILLSTSSGNAANATISTSSSPSLTAAKVTSNVVTDDNLSEKNVDMSKGGNQQLLLTSRTSLSGKKFIYPCDSNVSDFVRSQRNFSSSSALTSINNHQSSQSIILSSSGKANSSKFVTKITLTNPPKSQTTTTTTTTTASSSNQEIPDYDLGNILDIPIIFAKDDENLISIEKGVTPLFQTPPVAQEKKPTTKVVLISNKQDKSIKTRPVMQTMMRQGMLHQQHNIILQKNHPTTTIARAAKYTKIILAKRNSAAVQKDSDEQIVLTKKSNLPRISSSKTFSVSDISSLVKNQSESRDIEEMVEATVMERKLPSDENVEMEINHGETSNKNQTDVESQC